MKQQSELDRLHPVLNGIGLSRYPCTVLFLTNVDIYTDMLCLLSISLSLSLSVSFTGLHVNVVTYVALVMSIGLLVDFLMHVLLRYYESPLEGREPKVKDTLRTMGSSILIGGISTFLGVIPLAFSTSTIFNSIFVTFIGLVTLGAGHGLILLPVLLSLVGPKDKIDFGHEMPPPAAAASPQDKDDEALEEEAAAVAEDEG